MNVQTLEGVVFWCVWFTVLGFLQLLAMLSRDRFEYLSQLSTPAPHAPLLVVLLVVLVLVTACFVLSLGIGFALGMLQQMAFMAAECLLQLLSVLFVLTRYAIYMYDRRLSTRSQNTTHMNVSQNDESAKREGESRRSSLSSSGSAAVGVGWEHRFTAHYYSEFVFELLSLLIDFAHHVHMIYWSRVFVSMANLVILLQLRYFYYEFSKRCSRHLTYLRLRRLIHSLPLVPLATSAGGRRSSSELPVCAICWEAMVNARRLSCGHTYHDGCLHLWLEQDATCPACRASIAGAFTSSQQQHQRSSSPSPAFSFAELAVDTDTASSDTESVGRESVALDEFDVGSSEFCATAVEFATPDASSESRASSAAFHTPELTAGSALDSDSLYHHESRESSAAIGEQLCALGHRGWHESGPHRVEEEDFESDVPPPDQLFPTHPMQLTLDCGALASAPPLFRFVPRLRSAQQLGSTGDHNSCQSRCSQRADGFESTCSSLLPSSSGKKVAIASADESPATEHHRSATGARTRQRTRSLSLHASDPLFMALPVRMPSSPSLLSSCT